MLCENGNVNRKTKLDGNHFRLLVNHYKSLHEDTFTGIATKFCISFSNIITAFIENKVVNKEASCCIDGMPHRFLLKDNESGAYFQVYIEGSYGDSIGHYPGVVVYFFNYWLLLGNSNHKLRCFAFRRWFCQ